MSVSKSFTAVGSSDHQLMRHGESFTYSLSGTFSATLILEYTRDAVNWSQVLSATAATSGTVLVELQGRGTANYRWRCSAFTSGTAVTSITDTTETVDTVKNAAGAVVQSIDEAGNMTLTGSITATSATLSGVITNSAGAGAKNGATVSVAEYGDGVIHKTVLTCAATPITFADDADVAQYGGVKVYDFPDGLICTLGAVIDGALTLATPFIDTFTGVTALGTATAGTGATLTSTEADILQSTALTEAVAKVATADAISIATALTESGGRWLDGTGTAKDLFLNYAIADDVAHTAGAGTFTGTITVVWINLGDK